MAAVDSNQKERLFHNNQLKSSVGFSFPSYHFIIELNGFIDCCYGVIIWALNMFVLAALGYEMQLECIKRM